MIPGPFLAPGSGVPGSDITVRGGAGSMAVSFDELSASLGRLADCVEVIRLVGHRIHLLDWLTPAVARSVPADAVAVVDRTRTGLVVALGRLAEHVQGHTWRTRKALTAYWLAQRDAELGVLHARIAYPALILATTQLRILGLLRDGTAARAEPVLVGVDTRVEIRDLASIVTSQSLLSGGSTVRVVQLPRPDGTSAWIVQIPGTVTWNPSAGEQPNDLTADLELMARRSATLSVGVLDALDQAQRAAGRVGLRDPVMLTGHSLGGIAAASIAATPGARERHNITHVVTVGSPVAHIAVPEEVEVLSLVHTRDVVTRLGLAPNPDRLTWTTVERDVSDHGAVGYRETSRLAAEAIRTGSDPSLVRWAATAAPFLGAGTVSRGTADQRVNDYRVRRVTESRT